MPESARSLPVGNVVWLLGSVGCLGFAEVEVWGGRDLLNASISRRRQTCLSGCHVVVDLCRWWGLPLHRQGGVHVLGPPWQALVTGSRLHTATYVKECCAFSVYRGPRPGKMTAQACDPDRFAALSTPGLCDLDRFECQNDQDRMTAPLEAFKITWLVTHDGVDHAVTTLNQAGSGTNRVLDTGDG